MKAEQILCRAKIWNDLIPVPKEIDPECGMAVEIQTLDVDKVQTICNQNLVRIRSIYHFPGNGTFIPYQS